MMGHVKLSVIGRFHCANGALLDGPAAARRGGRLAAWPGEHGRRGWTFGKAGEPCTGSMRVCTTPSGLRGGPPTETQGRRSAATPLRLPWAV